MKSNRNFILKSILVAFGILVVFGFGFYYLYTNNFFINIIPFEYEEKEDSSELIEKKANFFSDKFKNLKENISDDKEYIVGNKEPFGGVEDEENK